MNQKWTESDIPDQTGQVAVVTGANSGIGFETARALAGKGATVVLACRNLTKGQEAIEKINAAHSGARVRLMALDLSSLQSIRDFTHLFKEKYDRLDLLINNAGVMVPPYSKTQEGFELQLGTNHLGHFALTGLLVDIMMRSGNGRVVNVSSMAHKTGRIDFADLQWDTRQYKPWQAYGDSKIANLYFTSELQRRLQEKGAAVKVTAAHPGWTATDLQRNSGIVRFLNNFFAQKPQAGAWPTLLAAVDSTASGGEFYGPDGFMEMKGHPKKVKTNKLAQDQSIAARLWDVSEQLTAVQYQI